MTKGQPIAQLHDISHLIARWLLNGFRPDLSPTTAEVFRNAITKFWKHEQAWDMTTFEGKAEATIKKIRLPKPSSLLCQSMATSLLKRPMLKYEKHQQAGYWKAERSCQNLVMKRPGLPLKKPDAKLRRP